MIGGNFALSVFGGLTKPYLVYFDALEKNLKKGEMAPLHEYLSFILLLSMAGFIVSVLLGSFFIAFFIPATAYSYTLSILISAGIGGMLFALGYFYPGLKGKGVEKEIERSLPFSTFYMATTASSGVNPVEIFKVLSLRRGVIGREAKRIYTNVKSLGSNLNVALQRAATRTPSAAFADLLWGMTSVITSGGDMEEYLRNKTETMMERYRRSLNDYAKAITLYTEIYITLVIVGSLFFIILIAIISPMTGTNTLLLQTFLVFFFVPLVSVAFIILLKSISPTE